MAHNLKMEVVAEGVETPEQLDFLRTNGCELVQGYLLARPVPAEQISGLLRTLRTGKNGVPPNQNMRGRPAVGQ